VQSTIQDSGFLLLDVQTLPVVSTPGAVGGGDAAGFPALLAGQIKNINKTLQDIDIEGFDLSNLGPEALADLLGDGGREVAGDPALAVAALLAQAADGTAPPLPGNSGTRQPGQTAAARVGKILPADGPADPTLPAVTVDSTSAAVADGARGVQGQPAAAPAAPPSAPLPAASAAPVQPVTAGPEAAGDVPRFAVGPGSEPPARSERLPTVDARGVLPAAGQPASAAPAPRAGELRQSAAASEPAGSVTAPGQRPLVQVPAQVPASASPVDAPRLAVTPVAGPGGGSPNDVPALDRPATQRRPAVPTAPSVGTPGGGEVRRSTDVVLPASAPVAVPPRTVIGTGDRQSESTGPTRAESPGPTPGGSITTAPPTPLP
jgi:hypothetical protein